MFYYSYYLQKQIFEDLYHTPYQSLSLISTAGESLPAMNKSEKQEP